ncbi:MAG TPA: di-heme oxidoredictase family protein, partial [Myxococcaceae bacterium]|nr:di-heme oxidoredictase family protein [Myxococcaceae bacterium]
REWRTAPLIGLRFSRHFLHDGRATTLQEAIVAHAGPGSEANDSVRRFQGLSDVDRQALVDFVHSL